MDFSFENWLKNRLIETTRDLGLEDIEFDVYNETDFVKHRELKERKILVCVKHLTASRVYSSQILPLQLTILSEQNTFQYSQVIFEKFCSNYNWFQLRENDSAYKMQFSSPAVMSNFNIVDSGYRTVLFVSASLVILDNICDIDELYLVYDDAGTTKREKIDFITASVSYGANMDSVQYAGSALGNAVNGELASSIKTSGALNMAITVASQNTTIVNKALNIMFGLANGNESYEFELTIGNVAINGLKVKQQSCVFATAKNDIPSIQLGFVR